MTNETGWIHWFHVDEVTITYHWTIKEGESGPLTEDIGAAEPEVPTHDPPSGSPVGQFWHMVYPDYFRTIEITSWIDSDSSGDFNPSDQFDYTYLPFDVLLAGSAPAAGVSLSTPGSTILYDDANFNGKWDVGEPPIDDLDLSGTYEPQVTEWAHLDAVSTDILVSKKPIPPEPPVFEFPFGVNLLMLLVPIIPLTYLWRLRKKVTKR
jgi:hypothetical protein